MKLTILLHKFNNLDHMTYLDCMKYGSPLDERLIMISVT